MSSSRISEDWNADFIHGLAGFVMGFQWLEKPLKPGRVGLLDEAFREGRVSGFGTLNHRRGVLGSPLLFTNDEDAEA
jgi:hypothetical protein